MVDEAEKRWLRQQGMAERDIQEIEDYEANIAMLFNRLLRPQRDLAEAETTRRLLSRFEWFAETDFDTPGASLNALDGILRDTLAHLLQDRRS
jgi:uncharacterized protein YigA (DUF484 family)